MMKPEDQEKLDRIADDLHVEGDVTFTDSGSCQTLESIITETLFRLTDEVYQELMHGEERAPISFFGCGAGQLGQALRWRIPVPPGLRDQDDFVDRDIILLSGELCTLPLEKAMFTVAHELAHVYLQHHVEHGV